MSEELEKDPVAYLNQSERVARSAMEDSGQVERWRNANNAFFGRQDIINPLGVNVNINYLRPKLITKWARDMQVLVGERPFFPIAADERESEQAKLREDLLDKMAEAGGFYRSISRVVLLTRGLGLSYHEPRVVIEKRISNKKVPIIDPVFGVLTGERTVRLEQDYECLRFVVHEPQAVFNSPHGTHLTDKPFTIIKETKHVSEIEEMVDTKKIKLAKGVSASDLRKSPGSSSGQGDWHDVWRRDLGVLGRAEMSDVGVLMRGYYNPTKEHPRGRWLFSWNYSILIQDEDCLWDNMGPKQKPLVAYHGTPVITSDAFDTLGIWDEVEERATLANDLRSIYVNDLILTIDPWMFYNPDVISPEQMRRAVRGPIESEQGTTMALKDAVWEVPRQRPPNDVMEISDKMDEAIDEDVGIFYTQSGGPAPRKETFGTTQILAQAGDARLEAETRDVEQSSYAETAFLVGKLIDASVTYETVKRFLGPDKADLFVSADPETLEYAWRWAFQGSSLVAKKQAENEALLKHWSLIGQDPGLDPAARFIPLQKIARRLGQYTDDEVRKMHPDPAEQMQRGMMTPPAGMPVEPVEPIIPPNQMSTPAFNEAANMGA